MDSRTHALMARHYAPPLAHLLEAREEFSSEMDNLDLLAITASGVQAILVFAAALGLLLSMPVKFREAFHISLFGLPSLCCALGVWHASRHPLLGWFAILVSVPWVILIGTCCALILLIGKGVWHMELLFIIASIGLAPASTLAALAWRIYRYWQSSRD